MKKLLTILSLMITLSSNSQIKIGNPNLINYELEDSLIVMSDRLPERDTVFKVQYQWDNKAYDYLVEKKDSMTTFTLNGEKRLYTDYRKIGGMSYFFGAWASMIGHGYIQTDKVAHFGAGWSMAMGGYFISKKLKFKHPIVFSIIFASVIGIAKETVWDGIMQKGNPSIMDAVWTGAGAYFGSITIPMFKTKPVKPRLIQY